LDVVVRQCPAILKLLACKDEPLLVWRNTFLVLDLGLHVINGVGSLNIKRDRLAREGLHKDLHAATEPQHQVQRRLLLNVIVRQGPAILKLLACEDEPLLVWRDAFLVLDLGLHVVNRIRCLDVERDGLASEGLDENLHATPEAQHQVQR